MNAKEIIKLIENTSEDVQLYVDMLSMWDQNSDKFKKYYDILKSKYGVDYHKINNDEHYISTANLDNIKTKDDFLSFDKYIIYAKEIYALRKIGIISLKNNREVDFETAKQYLTSIGVKVKYKKYSGIGNYAQASGNTIELSDEIDIGSLIHELGHVIDHTVYKNGISKVQTNASSYYMIGDAGEVFAENIMNFFLNPSKLKQYLPHVYKDLDKRISSKWKINIRKLMV
jgi:hypothetical protein